MVFAVLISVSSTLLSLLLPAAHFFVRSFLSFLFTPSVLTFCHERMLQDVRSILFGVFSSLLRQSYCCQAHSFCYSLSVYFLHVARLLACLLSCSLHTLLNKVRRLLMRSHLSCCHDHRSSPFQFLISLSCVHVVSSCSSFAVSAMSCTASYRTRSHELQSCMD